MSNGTVCCMMGVCCYPPGGGEAKEALAKEMESALSFDKAIPEDRRKLSIATASWLLDNFDLVPKGIAKAIIDGYGPEFEKLHGRGHGKQE